jgi:hypothetical protein
MVWLWKGFNGGFSGSGGAPSELWTPLNDMSRIVWYDFGDASTITITGAGISALVNKANPGTLNLSQATDSHRATWDGTWVTARPTNISTGLNITTTVNFTNAAYLQMHSAILRSNVAFTGRHWVVVAGSGRHAVSETSNLNRVSASTSGTTESPNVIVQDYANNTTTLLGTLFNGSTTKTLYNNGNVTFTDTSAQQSAGVGSLFQMLSGYAVCSMRDFIITGSITTDTRQKYEGFLAHRAGTQGSLDAGHPFKSRPPFTSD